MKLNNIVSVMCGLWLGFAVCSPTFAMGTDEGASPKLSKAEKAGLILYETLMGVTAGLITSGNGCAGVPGGPFSIDVSTDGAGSATYGSPNSPISLAITPIQTPGQLTGFGQKFDVSQEGVGYLDDVNSIRNYKGTLTYNDGGAILISSSVYEMLEFTEYVRWDEHNVKKLRMNDETERYIEEAGLEVISKNSGAISKWRQISEHQRLNDSNGSFTAKKYLITPSNDSDCSISLSATVRNQSPGQFVASGNIEVMGAQ